MASIRKHGSGWRVFIFKAGVRKTKVFVTKLAAEAWAAAEEHNINTSLDGGIPDKSFAELLNKYAQEVSPTKKGARWEIIRLTALGRDPIAAIRLADLDARNVSEWRDRRLQQVKASSLERDWVLMSHACRLAVDEWKWLRHNPFVGVRRPPATPSRDRLPTNTELDVLIFASGYDYNEPPATATARVGAAMLFAIETALRAGEIASLRWCDVELEKRFFRISGGKTNAAKRDVPLSTEALRIIRQMPQTGEAIFNLKTSQIDSLFRKIKAKALVENLHFHDMRHLAITRLANKLDVLALARVVGHRDLRMLQIYYNESAENLAERLI